MRLLESQQPKGSVPVLPPVQRKHEVHVEAWQVNIGRVHVGCVVMPGPMRVAGPVTTYVMPIPARAVPVMSASMRSSPMISMRVMPAPARAAPVMPAPVRSVSMMPVPVMCGLFSRPRRGRRGQGEEERQAGNDQPVEWFP